MNYSKKRTLIMTTIEPTAIYTAAEIALLFSADHPPGKTTGSSAHRRPGHKARGQPMKTKSGLCIACKKTKEVKPVKVQGKPALICDTCLQADLQNLCIVCKKIRSAKALVYIQGFGAICHRCRKKREIKSI